MQRVALSAITRNTPSVTLCSKQTLEKPRQTKRPIEKAEFWILASANPPPTLVFCAEHDANIVSWLPKPVLRLVRASCVLGFDDARAVAYDGYPLQGHAMLGYGEEINGFLQRSWPVRVVLGPCVLTLDTA